MREPTSFRYGSVCSGIEAATVAWHPLGWSPSFFSEIDSFPRAVLRHRWPDVPLHGDFTTIQADQYEPIDLLVGGTPCQSFSVAGLRGGLDDDRGNLALEFLRLADRQRPRWLVWENVPGVLSSTSHAAPDPCPPPPPLDLGCDGAEVETEDDYGSEELHAFYCFLAGLSDLGYGFAYRVLDAQFFGLAQRRRRVFVVGYLGDWRPAAAVLLERHGLSGHPAPRREAGASAACGTLGGTSPGGGWRFGADEAAAGQLIPQAFGGNDTRGPIDVATAVNAHGGPHGRLDFESETFVATALRGRDLARGVDSDCTNTLIAHALRGEGFDASEDGTGRGTPLVPVPIDMRQASRGARLTNNRSEGSSGGAPGTGIGNPGDPAFTVATSHVQAIALSGRTRGDDGRGYDRLPAYMLDAVGALDTVKPWNVTAGSAVRRLTPRECERLQGFPDDYTLIPWRGGMAADGPRYKALGNSMAVPVMRWIGRRIEAVEGFRVSNNPLIAAE